MEFFDYVVKGKEEWGGVSRVAKIRYVSVVLVLVGSDMGNAGYVRCASCTQGIVLCSIVILVLGRRRGLFFQTPEWLI